MAAFSKVTAVVAVTSLVRMVMGQSLVPEQDIVLPASGSGTDPLKFLGANSPYFAGPNVYGISSDVPEGCTVEQAAYVVRHGSRYPDNGAYEEWVALYEKIQNASYTSTGSLSFLPDWKPVLKFPSAQISQESITGYKESYDLGYELRVKYSDFYVEDTPFNVWANLYPRVVQTAQMFVRGYLGADSTTLGSVVTVNSTGSDAAVGDSLSPGDLCPLFDDDSGGDHATTFDSVYLPPITERLNALLTGNLIFDDSDVSLFPYLCGFESQIVGKLSPFCGIFTDEELLQYEYRQDLRYYYGVGPGTELEQLMMVPYLNSLVGLLAEGPGVTGVQANGSTFTLPKLIMNFLNDGQIAELAAAIGVFDDQEPLPADEVLANRTYIASHFVTMRGTVAFERLNCIVSSSSSSTGSSTSSSAVSPSSTSAIWAQSTLPVSSSEFITSTRVSSSQTTATSESRPGETISPFMPVPVAPAFSAPPASPGPPVEPAPPAKTIEPVQPAQPPFPAPPQNASHPAQPPFPQNVTHPIHPIQPPFHHNRRTNTSPTAPTNQTFIRVLLNDVVYPITACQNGPGSSCVMNDYVALLAGRYAASGNWADNCNVTGTEAGKVVKGASFLTDLGLDWVEIVGA